MSTNNDLTLKIAKIVGEMVKAEKIIEVDTVYEKLVQGHGSEIFQAERLLAQAMIRGKIKSHLKNAHAESRVDAGGQMSFLSEALPATLAIKQDDGGYVYVPINIADVDQIEAATDAKRANIRNAQRRLRTWEKDTQPLVAIMKEQKVKFGEARAIHMDRIGAVAVEVEDDRSDGARKSAS